MYTRAERRANVKKQLRDKYGKWVFMGGSVKFLYRGKMQVARMVDVEGDYAVVENNAGLRMRVHRNNFETVLAKAKLDPAELNDRKNSPRRAYERLGVPEDLAEKIDSAKTREEAQELYDSWDGAAKNDDKFRQIVNKNFQNERDQQFISDNQVLRREIAKKPAREEVGEVDSARRADLDAQIADLQEEEQFLRDTDAPLNEIRAVRKRREALEAERDGRQNEKPKPAPAQKPASERPLSEADNSVSADEIDELDDGQRIHLTGRSIDDNDIADFQKRDGNWVGEDEDGNEVEFTPDEMQEYLERVAPDDIRVVDEAPPRRERKNPFADDINAERDDDTDLYPEEDTDFIPDPEIEDDDEDSNNDVAPEPEPAPAPAAPAWESTQERRDRYAREQQAVIDWLNSEHDTTEEREQWREINSAFEMPSLHRRNNFPTGTEVRARNKNGQEEILRKNEDGTWTVDRSAQGLDSYELPADNNYVHDRGARGKLWAQEWSFAVRRPQSDDDDTDVEASWDDDDNIDEGSPVYVIAFDGASFSSAFMRHGIRPARNMEPTRLIRDDGYAVEINADPDDPRVDIKDPDGNVIETLDVDDLHQADRIVDRHKVGPVDDADGESPADVPESRAPLATVDELPEGSVVSVKDADGYESRFIKRDGAWDQIMGDDNKKGVATDDLVGDNLDSSVEIMREGHGPDFQLDPVSERDEDSPAPGAIAPGEVGRDGDEAYVHDANGIRVYKGTRVRSTRDGLEGEVVTIEKNGLFVKVKGDDGKIRGRRLSTLEVVDDDGDVDVPSAPAGNDGGMVERDSQSFNLPDSGFDALNNPENMQRLRDVANKYGVSFAYDKDGYSVRFRKDNDWAVVFAPTGDILDVVKPESGEGYGDLANRASKDYRDKRAKSAAALAERAEAEKMANVDAPELPEGQVGVDNFGRKYVTGSGGRPIFKGSKVRSKKDGLEGEVVTIENNGLFVKIRGEDGKVRGRRISTLQVLDPEPVGKNRPRVDAPDFDPNESTGVYDPYDLLGKYRAGQIEVTGRPGEGIMGITEFVTLSDGTKIVRKKIRGIHQGSAKDEFDSELLSGQLAARMGIDGFYAVDAGEDENGYPTLLMPRVNGKLGQYAGGGNYNNVTAPNAKEVAILDYLNNNSDRHTQNWMVDDRGFIIPIDHGGANWGDMLNEWGWRSPFLEHWLRNPDTNQIDGSSYTKTDIRRYIEALQSLSSEFGERGRVRWYDDSMTKLEGLLESAIGE